MQTLTVLGSTGSIGTSTLDVVARHPERYRVHALTASSQIDLMLAQCQRFRPAVAVMATEAPARALRDRCEAEGLAVEVRWGEAALCEVSADPAVDMVMAAIVGAAGLAPALAAALTDMVGLRGIMANKSMPFVLERLKYCSAVWRVS